MDMAGRKIDAVILSKFDTVDDKSRWSGERSDPKGHEANYYIWNGLGVREE